MGIKSSISIAAIGGVIGGFILTTLFRSVLTVFFKPFNDKWGPRWEKTVNQAIPRKVEYFRLRRFIDRWATLYQLNDSPTAMLRFIMKRLWLLGLMIINHVCNISFPQEVLRSPPATRGELIFSTVLSFLAWLINVVVWVLMLNTIERSGNKTAINRMSSEVLARKDAYEQKYGVDFWTNKPKSDNSPEPSRDDDVAVHLLGTADSRLNITRHPDQQKEPSRTS